MKKHDVRTLDSDIGGFRLYSRCGIPREVINEPIPYFRVRVIVLHATFSNISDISWRSVLLVEENGVPGETQ
jgi:hypothetical protein